MERNLTLSIDESLMIAARKAAIDRHSSINALVREHLIEIAANQTVVSEETRAEILAALEPFFRNRISQLPSDYIFDRDELHDRKA